MAGATSEVQEFISDEWTVEVEDILTEIEKPVKIDKTSMWLPRALINVKQEAYIPQMLSLGPYHYRTLHDQALPVLHYQRVNHLSQMDFYKLKSIREATQNKTEVIINFFGRVSEMVQEFEEFYDWKTNDNQKFGRMIMLDAFFLHQFLKNGFHVLKREFIQTEKRYSEILMPTLTTIRCDIVKLENQIPLSLLKQIDIFLDTNTVETFLNTQISQLSCLQSSSDVKIKYDEESHLLGCMHKYVSSLLQIHSPQQQEEEMFTCCERFITAIDYMIAAILGLFFPHPARGRNDFLDSYNAIELDKAGIQFKSGSDEIGFDKQSGTLFLPQIVISDTYTEVTMRNLLALEFNDPNRPKNVTQYVELMDCLIDTPKDVVLLRKKGDIKRQSMMITDEQVVKMWDGMAKPLFFAGFEEHPHAIKSGIREALINKYYISKVRKWWVEFHGEHLSRPWKALALLTAILVVGLTAAQTYCAFAQCQKKP